ncbi:hypothetical protein IW261DRAFT_1423219 [Armillaria novae-zelandiae]|uniref:Uncharacterized protein n=1 Tax=Armillaria novae-zelandiae TaxID=153914 RepID=A0AA39TZA5_9AGAR|nr:hypothetical protein IW261DRAFT_1423219 [Armillaria novae-zelandiae]
MFVPMAHCEEAERQQVVDIDPNNILCNPIGFSRYTGSEGGLKFCGACGRKHRGKRMDQCSDGGWMLRTMKQSILTDKSDSEQPLVEDDYDPTWRTVVTANITMSCSFEIYNRPVVDLPEVKSHRENDYELPPGRQ